MIRFWKNRYLHILNQFWISSKSVSCNFLACTILEILGPIQFNSIQFNSIQFKSIFISIKKKTYIKKHQNNKERKYGGKYRKADKAWWLFILEKEKKKIVTKHPNNHITKPNKKRRQNKRLCLKERNYSQFEIRVFLYWFWNCLTIFEFMIFWLIEFQRMGPVIRTEWSEKCFLFFC